MSPTVNSNATRLQPTQSVSYLVCVRLGIDAKLEKRHLSKSKSAMLSVDDAPPAPLKDLSSTYSDSELTAARDIH
jgi:hypothetical protein